MLGNEIAVIQLYNLTKQKFLWERRSPNTRYEIDPNEPKYIEVHKSGDCHLSEYDLESNQVISKICDSTDSLSELHYFGSNIIVQATAEVKVLIILLSFKVI